MGGNLVMTRLVQTGPFGEERITRILCGFVTNPPRPWLFDDLGIAAQRRTRRSRSFQRESIVKFEFPFRVTYLYCSLVITRSYRL